MSLPALPCPAPFCPAGPPCWAHPGAPASKGPAQRGPGEMPVVLVPPSASVLGSDFCWAVQGDLAKLWGCYLYTTWPTYNTKALLFPLLPWFSQQSQAACEQRAEGTLLGQRAASPCGQLGNPDLHPRTLSWNGKFTRTPFLRGFLRLWGSPRERCCTDI